MTRPLPTLLAATALHLVMVLPVTAQDGMTWFYDRYVDPDPVATSLMLVYGIPQTDAVLAYASCEIGAAGPHAVLEFAADVGAMPEGAATQITFTSDAGQTRTMAANVVGRNREEGFTGVFITLDLGDEFLTDVPDQGRVTYAVQGHGAQTLPLDGISAPMSQFLHECGNIANLGQLSSSAAQMPKDDAAAPVPDSCETLAGARSLNGDTPQRVTFVNSSDGYRGLLWVDYQGTYVDYASLDIGEQITVDTYLTHPWMISDGPGNCLEMMEPQPGQGVYEITVPGRYFGEE